MLRFLGGAQDVTGKVPHEVTTSGLAHYDAADSTPLYLLLAGRYASWTGDLAFLEADAQVAALLVEYAESFGVLEGHGVRLELQLSQESMALDLALSRKSVTRTLSRFRDDGWVDKRQGRYVVRDLQALRRLSGRAPDADVAALSGGV